MDADDWIDEDMCECLYQAANGADLCGADYYITKDGTDTLTTCDYDTMEDLTTVANKVSYLKNNGLFVTRLYRREFLIEHDILFPEKIVYEDSWFNTMAGFHAKNVVKVDRAFYHYVQLPLSLSHGKNQEHSYDRIEIANLTYDACKERGVLEKYEEIVRWKYTYMMASNILYVCLDGFDKPDIKRLYKVRNDLKKRFCKGQGMLQGSLRRYYCLTLLSPRLALWYYKSGLDGYVEALMYKLGHKH